MARTQRVVGVTGVAGVGGARRAAAALAAGLLLAASAALGQGVIGQPIKPFEWPAVRASAATVRSLAGSYRAPAAHGQPELHLHLAAVNVEGLADTLYFELSRADSPNDPFRSGVLQVRQEEGVLRVYQFSGVNQTGGAFTRMLAGLWAAPEAFPALKAEQLTPVSDIAVTRRGEENNGRAELRSAAPIPTVTGGAASYTTVIEAVAGTQDEGKINTIRWSDRGLDAAGAQVWGPPEGQFTEFARFEPETKVDRRDGGLIVIDLRPGDLTSEPSASGSQLALEYSGWLHASGLLFDSSREANRDPFTLQLPAQVIQGWNAGVPGIRQGGIRRLIIPGALGYGPNGNPRARIPGDAALVFEIECVYHKPAEKLINTAPAVPTSTPTPTPPTPPAPPAPPAPAPSTRAPSAPQAAAPSPGTTGRPGEQ